MSSIICVGREEPGGAGETTEAEGGVQLSRLGERSFAIEENLDRLSLSVTRFLRDVDNDAVYILSTSADLGSTQLSQRAACCSIGPLPWEQRAWLHMDSFDTRVPALQYDFARPPPQRM